MKLIQSNCLWHKLDSHQSVFVQNGAWDTVFLFLIFVAWLTVCTLFIFLFSLKQHGADVQDVLQASDWKHLWIGEFPQSPSCHLVVILGLILAAKVGLFGAKIRFFLKTQVEYLFYRQNFFSFSLKLIASAYLVQTNRSYLGFCCSVGSFWGTSPWHLATEGFPVLGRSCPRDRWW